MSLLMQIQTSDDDSEIEECLEMVLDSARLGLMHESVDVNHITSYTSELRFPPPHTSLVVCSWLTISRYRL